MLILNLMLKVSLSRSRLQWLLSLISFLLQNELFEILSLRVWSLRMKGRLSLCECRLHFPFVHARHEFIVLR